jgi:Fe-S cluster assembly protein SufD
METIAQPDFKQWVLSQLERQPPAASIRQRAAHTFAALSVPTPKHEEWKYTNLKNVLGRPYEFAPATSVNVARVAHFTQQYDEGTANVLVFVNGAYVPQLSHLSSSEQAVVVCPLREAFAKYPAVVEEHFGQYAGFADHLFAAMNTALAQDGTFVWVKPGQVVEQPIIVHYIADAHAGNTLALVRNLFVVGAGGQATVIEHYNSTATEFAPLTNMVTEAHVAPNGRLDHYKIQHEADNASHIGLTQARQERDSHYANTTISLSGQVVRNNLHIDIAGQNCEAYMNGLMAITGGTLVDNHTAVDHQQPHSQSNQLYKGLLDGKSSGVFNGKIFVRPDAQKTNAYQSSKNILLSESANMDAKPQLEIWADDVKCSHGHATGALDEEPLFYLRARGITADNARALLMFAFAEDVLARIGYEPVRHYTEKVIAERLHMDVY